VKNKPEYANLRIAHGKDRCANPPRSGPQGGRRSGGGNSPRNNSSSGKSQTDDDGIAGMEMVPEEDGEAGADLQDMRVDGPAHEVPVIITSA
jgi:hypothetical protein